ncbi:MAG: DHH family phosphoesterase, partial [Planctomycetota bacterium]
MPRTLATPVRQPLAARGPFRARMQDLLGWRSYTTVSGCWGTGIGEKTVTARKRMMGTSRTTRSQRFLELITDYPAVVVVAHTNPDPDAIASGWALVTLIREKLDKQVRLVAGGAILRAENLRMVDLLKPPIELVEAIDFDP